MKKLIVLNHAPDEAMVKELGGEIVTLGDLGLAGLWSQIPAGKDEHGIALREHIKPLLDEIGTGKYDTVVVAGEPRACFVVASACHEMGAVFGKRIACYAPTSVRESRDEPQPDGSIKKTAVFRFAGLAAYY